MPLLSGENQRSLKFNGNRSAIAAQRPAIFGVSSESGPALPQTGIQWRRDLTNISLPPLKPASSAIVERDGKFLLVRRKNPPAADMYAFPGGRGEPGETADQTALRELAEETGIIARNPVLFAAFDLRSDATSEKVASHFFLSVFRVETDSHIDPVAMDDAESVGWHSLEEMETLPMPQSMRICMDMLKAGRLRG